MMLRGCNPLGGKFTLLTQQKEQLYVITYKTWNRKGSDDKLGVLSRPTHLRGRCLKPLDDSIKNTESEKKMKAVSKTQSKPIYFPVQASLLLFFSYGTAFIATYAVHELGHLIVNLIKGLTITDFVVHPFLLTYVSALPLTESFDVYISGTLFAIVVCSLIGSIFWKKRSTSNLPLLFFVPMTFLMESMNILTGPTSPGSDFYKIMELTGLPANFFIIIGIVFLCIGIFFFMTLFPLIGIDPEGRKSTTLIAIFLGFSLYNVLLAIYTYLFATEEFLFYRANNFLIIGGMLALIITILYVTLYRKYYRKLPSTLRTDIGTVTWKDLQIPGAVFILILAFSLLFFN